MLRYVCRLLTTPLLAPPPFNVFILFLLLLFRSESLCVWVFWLCLSVTKRVICVKVFSPLSLVFTRMRIKQKQLTSIWDADGTFNLAHKQCIFTFKSFTTQIIVFFSLLFLFIGAVNSSLSIQEYKAFTERN